MEGDLFLLRVVAIWIRIDGMQNPVSSVMGYRKIACVHRGFCAGLWLLVLMERQPITD